MSVPNLQMNNVKVVASYQAHHPNLGEVSAQLQHQRLSGRTKTLMRRKTQSASENDAHSKPYDINLHKNGKYSFTKRPKDKVYGVGNSRCKNEFKRLAPTIGIQQRENEMSFIYIKSSNFIKQKYEKNNLTNKSGMTIKGTVCSRFQTNKKTKEETFGKIAI